MKVWRIQVRDAVNFRVREFSSRTYCVWVSHTQVTWLPGHFSSRWTTWMDAKQKLSPKFCAESLSCGDLARNWAVNIKRQQSADISYITPFLCNPFIHFGWSWDILFFSPFKTAEWFLRIGTGGVRCRSGLILPLQTDFWLQRSSPFSVPTLSCRLGLLRTGADISCVLRASLV